MIALTLVYFFSFSIFEFICSQNANFKAGKNKIEILNDYNFSHSEYLKRIEKACQESSVDVMFSYMVFENNTNKEKELVIFKTNNSQSFLPVKAKKGNILLLDNEALSTDPSLINDGFKKGKLLFVDYFYDYTLYPLSCITQQQIKKSECLVNSSDATILSSALKKQKLSMKIELSSYNADYSLRKILYIGLVIMLLLSFLSMFFKQFSESKHIAVKRLEGYTLLQSLVDVFKEFLLYYIVLFFICIIASLVAFSFISEIELGVFYFINNYKIILFVFFIIPILYSLSCVNIYLVKPLETLKGNNNKKGVYLLTIVSKYLIIGVLVIISSTNISTLASYYNQMKAYQSISADLKDYYALTNTAFNEDMEKGYSKFYDITHYSNQAIMMNAMRCKNSEWEDDIANWYVIINDNYMDFNPIFTPDGKKIEYDTIKEKKANILIPEGVSKESVVSIYAKRLNVRNAELNVLTYDVNQKFYCFEIMNSKHPGYIMHPIVIIHQPENGVSATIANGELIFKAHTSDFNSEILPILRECDIDWMTGSTPSVKSIFDSYINDLKIEVITYSLVILLFIFLFICTVIYEAITYFKNHQKKFTILKMNGFSFIMIHFTQIYLRIIVCCILLFICQAYHFHLLIPIVICLVDYSIFYIILEFKTDNYSSSVLKGA
jgi:hypothetical protein